MIGHGARHLLKHAAKPSRLQGPIIEAPLQHTFIGERCDIKRSIWDDQILCSAQTIGFGANGAILSLLGDSVGLSRDCLVVPNGQGFSIEASELLLGSVVGSDGELRERFAEARERTRARTMTIDRAPPDFGEREPIDQVLVTGVRSIDALLTCGQGQRVGIFAPAGGGKTSLLSMLIAHSEADVYIVGLVGERGREAAEFIRNGIPEHKRHATVVVCATSDRPSVERRNAALIATTLAEYFRDQGKHVMLLIDSMTRYARALRDVALAAGEFPATRGYPASVFEELPKILERSGRTRTGCISAFYTVLLEDEEDSDPIGDEIRSILDGHIYLSRALAGRGHFPAIDVLGSASRVFRQVVDDDHLGAAQSLRGKLGRLEELRLVLDLGEYRFGESTDTDRLIEQKDEIEDFLRQDMRECSLFAETQGALSELSATD
ncbi:type III secretion system ATPase SctN [Pseudomonas batumici]|uniref:type III secretion system ATPase SctN n=1 Tax=Pseudomonas batumici TaxID=226910 RepID=UPI0030CC860E